MSPKISVPLLASASVFAFSALAVGQDRPAGNWRDILSPPQGEIPEAPEGKVEWRTDFYAALGEAKASGRPLLVTWRCLPCKQCAAFDKDVLEGGPELSPLLKQFVTVRMTDAGQLDSRYFPYRGYQDLDLSWWGYFLSPEGKLYGVFGGKDHVSDTTRISTAAFAKTMRRVLEHHHDPRRESWGKVDGEVPDAAQPKSTPTDLSTFGDFKEGRPWVEKQTCVHCHQVNDILHFDAMQAGRFDLQAYTEAWPLPENVGIYLDRDDGLSVTKIEAGSAAERAGLRAGDSLRMADGRKLYGQADFRGALHRADHGGTTVDVAFERGGEIRFAAIKTGDGWKRGENAWRKSVYEGIYGPHLGFFPLHGPGQGKGAMSFRPFMGPGGKLAENKWYPAGLRPNMEIVEVNGRSDDWDARQFLAWFRLNHKAGDSVTLKTRDGKSISRTLGDSD